MKNYRLIIALICLLGASFAQAKVERITSTNDPAAAVQSVKKVLKKTGLDKVMTEVKELKADWLKSGNGLKEVVLDSDGFDAKKMTGMIKVVAISNNGQKAVMATSDQAKINSIKAEELKKTLKESGLL